MSRNIASLGDLRKKDAEKKAADDKRNEFFVGGLDQRGGGSGLAVEGPPSSVPHNNIFDRIVQRAQESVGDGAPPDQESSGSRRVITMYRNGFMVDDGPFRDMNSPENQAFIRALEQGVVPPEMSQGSQGEIEVALNDKRTEDYTPPPPPSYVAFSGGATLGTAKGPGVGGGSGGAWVASPDDSALASAVAVGVPVNESQPNSVVQVKTLDGKRLRIRINNSATVRQLAAAIISQGAGGQPFVLNAGFPPKDVTDPDSSLADARLVGSSVNMKSP